MAAINHGADHCPAKVSVLYAARIADAKPPL